MRKLADIVKGVTAKRAGNLIAVRCRSRGVNPMNTVAAEVRGQDAAKIHADTEWTKIPSSGDHGGKACVLSRKCRVSPSAHLSNQCIGLPKWAVTVVMCTYLR